MCRLGYLCYDLVAGWFYLLVPAKWLVRQIWFFTPVMWLAEKIVSRMTSIVSSRRLKSTLSKSVCWQVIDWLTFRLIDYWRSLWRLFIGYCFSSLIRDGLRSCLTRCGSFETNFLASFTLIFYAYYVTGADAVNSFVSYSLISTPYSLISIPQLQLKFSADRVG